MLGFIKTKEFIIIVMEYIPRNLRTILKDEILIKDDVLTIFRNISGALEYLHKNNMIHRDFKPENILVQKLSPSNQYIAKICDFGISNILFTPSSTSIVGSLLYMAPEQLDGSVYDSRIDLWSLGCVLFEMVYKRKVFKVNSIYDLVIALQRNDIEYDDNDFGLKDLMQGLLKKQREDRFSWEKINEVLGEI